MRFNKLRIILLFCTVAGFAVLFLDLGAITSFQPARAFPSPIQRFSDGQPSQNLPVNVLSVIKDYLFHGPCKPALSLVFVKTHKTGSTTVSSVVNRFGFSRNASFLLCTNDTSYGHFRQDFPDDVRDILPPVGVPVGQYTNYRDFDLMTSHIRFLPNNEFLRRYMRQGSKAITVLREPTKQWVSAFLFFNCAKFMQILKKNTSEKVEIFFSHPLRYWKSVDPGQCKYYTRNGMWYDLSSNNAIHTNESAVYRELKVLDQHLDLVLITEYLDESLILLKKLMCWDYEDILYVTLNQRNTTSEVTETQRIKIASWNMADVILYDHYNQTLWKKVQEYGPSFDQDLAHFRTLLKEYMSFCGIGDTTKFRSKHRIAFVAQNSSLLCQSLVTEDNKQIVKRQKTPLSDSRRIVVRER